MWLLLAFSGPVLWAVSTHIDKYLVDQFFKNSDTAVLMVFTALIGLILLPVIAIFQPIVARPLDEIVMIGSGILYMGAMLLYLRAIQSAEVSIVAPLFQTSALFTFGLAYIFLDEVLSWRQMAGGALVISGSLSLSFDKTFHFGAMRFRLVALMLGCTFVLAMSSVLFKFFALRDAFWVTTFWIYVGEGLFGFGIMAVPKYRHQFRALFRRSPGAVIALNGANELINLGGSLGVRFASLLAPVALVSAVSATSSLFVFAFGIFLTVFLPKLGREDLSWQGLAQKGIGATLVSVGVLLLGDAGN